MLECILDICLNVLNINMFNTYTLVPSNPVPFPAPLQVNHTQATTQNRNEVPEIEEEEGSV
jgi:hypothetical protein